MIRLRPKNERGSADFGWLKTSYSFSFGQYYDPNHMGFGPLRVINEDYIEGGRGFPTHPHDNMEIVTYVMDGALAHKDSMGNGSVIKPGDIQRMSAGTGITHSEYNEEKEATTHIYQIWFLPETEGIAPSYEQKSFEDDRSDNALGLVMSQDGRDDSVHINQDVDMYIANLGKGRNLTFKPRQKGRLQWIQILKGDISINGTKMTTSDGATIEDETALEFEAENDSKIMLFDMTR